jgi:uncharacterized membrane protein
MGVAAFSTMGTKVLAMVAAFLFERTFGTIDIVTVIGTHHAMSDTDVVIFRPVLGRNSGNSNDDKKCY